MHEELDPGIDATDSGSDLLELDPPALPKWISKAVTAPSTCADRRRPQIGDEVSIRHRSARHKSGSPLHGHDGNCMNSMEVIALGDDSIHEAWTHCLVTMQRGEAARFVVNPPKSAIAEVTVPSGEGKLTSIADRLAQALPLTGEAVALDIELVDWVSFVRITEDGSLLKRILTRPNDRRKAAVGQVCLLSYSLYLGAASDEAVQEIPDFQHVLMGSQEGAAVGDQDGERCPLVKSEVLDAAIISMRRGEISEVQFAACYGLPGDWLATSQYKGQVEEKVRCRLHLREFLETEDVSFTKDGSVVKTSLQCRDSWTKCTDGAWCRLRVRSSESAEEEALEFEIGNGIVCDTLEAVTVSLRVSELAGVECKTGHEASVSMNGKDLLVSRFHVQVEEYKPGPLDGPTTDSAKLNFIEARREVAAGLFAAGRYVLAGERYRACLELLGYVDDFGNMRMGKDRKAFVSDLKVRCALSRSLCCIRSGQFRSALEALESVLEEQPHNIKGLYRRAQARLGLEELDSAEQDAKSVLHLQPANTEARDLLREILAQQKQTNRLAKPLCEQMCRALGTLPHPLDVD
mmetsp:Transcript_18257/g.42541  ORF Transcript_18257/g.42541 Transcript_18257/m.42541 type:complete len:576 (+) Transcript_18257:153-1880(+)